MSADDPVKKFVDTLGSTFETHLRKAAANSWFLQDRVERRARLNAVLSLSAELERVKAITIQSTAHGEGAIEAIITGTWDIAEDYIKWLSFPEEGREPMRAIWENFVVVLRTACEERKRNLGSMTPAKPH